VETADHPKTSTVVVKAEINSPFMAQSSVVKSRKRRSGWPNASVGASLI
jgi:hypothetical protein